MNRLALFLFFVSLNAAAQFVEEQSTLESLYETRARAVLNTLLRTNEYSVVISADIDRNQAKLKDYEEQVELQYLPGLPMPADPAHSPATNTLHELKNRITVDVILDLSVAKEKEGLVKSLLTSKLHLDESNGDTVTIQRSGLKEPVVPQPEAEPSLLPEFSWKMWILVLILGLSLLAAAVLWASRRQRAKAAEGEKEKRSPALPENMIWPFENPQKATAEKPKEEPRVSVEQLYQMKDKFLTLVTQIPQISSRSLAEFLEEGSDAKAILVFEHLGWDLAKKLFPTVPPRVWGRLGSKVRGQNTALPLESYLEAYENMYKFLLSRFLNSHSDNEKDNPFDFLFKLTKSERHHILADESASHIATISLFCSREELDQLTEELTPKIQSQLPIEIARLETLPDSAIKLIANSLKMKLDEFRKAPVLEMDSIEVASKLIRSYSPEREAEVFKEIAAKSPEQADRIRRRIVQFADLTLYPEDITSVSLNYFEVDEIAKVLQGTNSELSEYVLSLMPPKRANMIRMDIQSPATKASGSEVAKLRRSIALKMEEIIRGKGYTMEDVWAEIDKQYASKKLRASA